MAYTLIAGTMAGGTSARFNLEMTNVPATLSAPGLASGETVDIQVSQDNGSTYANTGLQLDDTTNTKIIEGPGIYRVVLSATAANVAVALHRNNEL